MTPEETNETWDESAECLPEPEGCPSGPCLCGITSPEMEAFLSEMAEAAPEDLAFLLDIPSE